MASRQGCLHNNQHSSMLVLNKNITAVWKNEAVQMNMWLKEDEFVQPI